MFSEIFKNGFIGFQLGLGIYFLLQQRKKSPSERDIFNLFWQQNIYKLRVLVSYYFVKITSLVIIEQGISYSRERVLMPQNARFSVYLITRISSGKYLAIKDFQLLKTNKFVYIINCSAQTPNYFDNHDIRYLKFKLINQRSHKLRDQSMKKLRKLRKLQKFIGQAEQQSLCCIIFSSGGNIRSLVIFNEQVQMSLMQSQLKGKAQKTKSYKRIAQNSSSKRQKKLQQGLSMQFRKIP